MRQITASEYEKLTSKITTMFDRLLNPPSSEAIRSPSPSVKSALRDGLEECSGISALPEREVTWIQHRYKSGAPIYYGTRSCDFFKHGEPMGMLPATLHTSKGPVESTVIVDLSKQDDRYAAAAYGLNGRPSIRGSFYLTSGRPGDLKGIGNYLRPEDPTNWVLEEYEKSIVCAVVEDKDDIPGRRSVEVVTGLDVHWFSMEVAQ